MSIQGLEALQRALKDQTPRVRDMVAQAVAVTTFAVQQRIQATVPRASGVLASHISSTSRGMSGRVEIGAEAWYWHFVEYGTVRMGAKPFIRPAAELEAPIFERRIKDIARRLEAEFGRTG